MVAILGNNNWAVHPNYANILHQTVPCTGPWVMSGLGGPGGGGLLAGVLPPVAVPGVMPFGWLAIGPGNAIPDLATLADVLASTFAETFNDQLKMRAGIQVRNSAGFIPVGPPLFFSAVSFRLIMTLHVYDDEDVEKYFNLDTHIPVPTIREDNFFALGGGPFVPGTTHHRVVDVPALILQLTGELQAMQMAGSDAYSWSLISFQSQCFSFLSANNAGGCSRSKKDSSVIINSLKYFSPRGIKSKHECFYRCMWQLIKTQKLLWHTHTRITKFIKDTNDELGWVPGTLVHTNQIVDFARHYQISVAHVHSGMRIRNQLYRTTLKCSG